MTTAAGSGHPTSSLSAVEAMSVLLFGRWEQNKAFFHFDPAQPDNPANDRLIFSKGHAAPLYYALWAAAGVLEEHELMTLRRFDSPLEGHPTRRFALTEVPTGSLGQGLSVGVGEALSLRAQGSDARVFVLLGDSEMAEGQVWEAMALAAHNHLNHLVAIVDVNRLGQRGATMLGHDTETYRRRAEAFGWRAEVVDGHDSDALAAAYMRALASDEQPVVIIARTIKGHGVSFLEDAQGWHGRALTPEELVRARAEIGAVDRAVRGTLAVPEAGESGDDTSSLRGAAVRKHCCDEAILANEAQDCVVGAAPCVAPSRNDVDRLAPEGIALPTYTVGQEVAPRVAYGETLAALARADERVVALDAETSNSTKAAAVKEYTPAQFYEMFIAEQNMASVAVGMARRGLRPFVSTFAAFLTRAADQIRMAQYADVPITFVGSHAGVSIGADGASQMGLEDMALFGALRESITLYPADATSTAHLTMLAYRAPGISYVRTTRAALPVLYGADAVFEVGGSHTLRTSAHDVASIIAAGITVHEALEAADTLAHEGINVRVIDCYSVRPLDGATVRAAARETAHVIVVEDHHAGGGLGAAVCATLSGMATKRTHLCVRKAPRSGTPAQLLAYEEIDAAAIVHTVREVVY